MKLLKAIFIKPDGLKSKISKNGALLSLIIFIISLILVKASVTLSVFTGKAAHSIKITIGPRDTGTKFIIPSYVSLIYPLISVPVVFYLDSLLLLITAKILKVKSTFSQISTIFAYLINIKTLENIILFLVYAILKKYDFSFSLIVGRFDVFTILLLYNLPIAVGDEREEKQKLTIGVFVLYIIIEIIFILMIKK